jgi:hypothetical protein
LGARVVQRRKSRARTTENKSRRRILSSEGEDVPDEDCEIATQWRAHANTRTAAAFGRLPLT